jgi:superfamily II DNA or RNA helicase
MTEHPYTLTQFQEDVIREIANRFAEGINPVCDLPTGEGKTVIACSLIRALIEEGETGFLVIARANNLLDPWTHELKKFSLHCNLIHGLDRKDKRINGRYPLKKSGVILTSHQTAASDMDYFANTEGLSLIIIDEIHVSNNSKKLTNMTIQFSRLAAKRKLFLTATPIQNSRNELALLNILLNKPDLIDGPRLDKEILDAQYQEAGKNRILIHSNMENRQTDNIIRREIKISKTVLAVPLAGEMEEYIVANENYFFYTDITGGFSPKKILFQYLSHPDSIFKNNAAIKHTHKCGKTEAVLSIVKNIPGNDKIIIFSQYKDVLYRYFKLLNETGHRAVIITGEDRSELHNKLRLFKETGIYRVLLTTLFKSAEGLNLKEANHVIILEFWWNPQKIIQAMGRVTRKNQEKDVFIYLLCYNKDGGIYEHEALFLETMKKKIAEAKEAMPAQAELPDIKVFGNKDTYKEELEVFLHSFLNPVSPPNRKKFKVIIKRGRNAEKPEPVINVNTEAEGQTSRGRLNDLTVNRYLFASCFQSISENYNKKFDDLNLAESSEEKPHQ